MINYIKFKKYDILINIKQIVIIYLVFYKNNILYINLSKNFIKTYLIVFYKSY